MNHLTESQFNEYLDGALDAPSRTAADEHLAACESCRRALADLETVASMLASLPDEPLTRDLTPSVLAGLPAPRLPLGWKLAFAVEAGIGIGAGLLLLSHLLPAVSLPAVPDLPALFLPILELPTIRISLPSPPFTLHPSSFSIAFLALSALLLWSVGNAILLRGRPEVRQ